MWTSDSFVINILIFPGIFQSDISISQQTLAPKPSFVSISEAQFTLSGEIQTCFLTKLTGFGNLCLSLDASHSSANLSSIYCILFQDFDRRDNKRTKHSSMCL